MKLLLLFIFCFLSTGSISANTSQTFLFDGSHKNIDLQLQDEVFRTEYRYETVEKTCYKESTEYQTQCADVPRQNCTSGPQICHVVPQQQCRPVSVPPVCRNVCHNGPEGQICKNVCSGGGSTQQCHTVNVNQCSPGQQVCTTYMNRECRTIPIHHSTPYSCTDTVRVPYQVFDHTTQARVRFKFDKTPKGKLEEIFSISLINDNILLSVKSSKRYLINSVKNFKETINGNTKMLDYEFLISFVDVSEVQEALSSISKISINNNELSYYIGKATNLKFKHHIDLKQKKLFGKKTLIDRALTDDEVESINEAGLQKFVVSLSRLDIIVKERTHFATIQVELNLDGYNNLLNASDLKSLKLHKEEKIKL